MPSILARAASIAFLLAVAGEARAGYIAAYDIGNLSYLQSSYFFNQTLNRIVEQSAARNAATGPRQTTIVERGSPGATSTPAKLAASYPPESRAAAEQVFREMLKGYAKLEQQFGIPKNDLAGALSAFIAGSYIAYRNADFRDEHFVPLVTQLRGAMAVHPQFARLTATEKRDLYEQLAILGMYLATTQLALKTTPDARVEANMRDAGKRYLQQFLGTTADRVAITSKGLVLAPPR